MRKRTSRGGRYTAPKTPEARAADRERRESQARSMADLAAWDPSTGACPRCGSEMEISLNDISGDGDWFEESHRCIPCGIELARSL